MDRTIILYILLDLITVAHSERVILLNTTRDGWKFWRKNTDKYQGWRIQNLPPNADEVYGVCNVNQRSPNSWLRSPFIPRDRGINLHVNMSFTMRRCEGGVTCEEVLYLMTYEADVDTEEIQYNEKFFKNVETISSDVKWEGKDRTENILNQHESTISVRRAGVIIAFKSRGSCVMIKEVVVYYSHCIALVSNFVSFPQAATGTGTQLRSIEGQCVDGAVKMLSTEQLLNLCQSNGKWVKEIYPQMCECSPGHERDYTGTNCPKCTTNFFKSISGNSACLPCPQNSHSPLGSARCTCGSGFYEIPRTGVDLLCKKPPRKPRNLQINSTDVARITITWESPGSDETSLKYSISCFDCPNKIQISPSIVISGYKVAVHGALPSREYNFKVSTENDVTPFITNAFDIDQSASKISVLTNPLAENIEKLVIDRAEMVDNSILLQWQKPRSTTDHVEYECVLYGYKTAIAVADAKDSDMEEYSFTLRTEHSFKMMGAQIFRYAVKVRWRSAKGWGHFSDMKFIDLKRVTEDRTNVLVTVSPNLPSNTSTLSKADSMPSNSKKDVILVVVGVALLVIVVTIVVILVCYCVRRQMVYSAYRMKIKKSNFECANPAQMIYSSAYSLPIQQSFKYHDPVTYSDISIALHDFTKEIDPSWITMDALIGEGQIGDVFYGAMKTPGADEKVVAIKVLKASASSKERNNFLVEASTMGQFMHENIVRLQGVVSLSEPYMIVTDYMVNGALLNFLITNKDNMSITEQLKMLRNVASGMRYLSSMGFVHRDLAARNILLDNDLTCKIADFGLSRELSCDDVEEIYLNKNEFKIPIKWTSPEAILYNRFSHASDVWSYGVLAWEILSYGEKPYWQWSNQEVIDAIQSGYRLPPPVNCQPIVHNFMLHCWNNSADQRPTFAQLFCEVEKLISRFQIPETDFSRKEYKCCEKALLLRHSHCDVGHDIIAPPPPPRNVVFDSRNVRMGSMPDTQEFPLTLTRQSAHCGPSVTDSESLIKEPIMTLRNIPRQSYYPTSIFYQTYTPQSDHQYRSYGSDPPDVPNHNLYNSSSKGSMVTIEEFLSGIKTPQYITLMRRLGIQTVDQLRHVKYDNLKSMGIASEEHRVSIIKALQSPTYC